MEEVMRLVCAALSAILCVQAAPAVTLVLQFDQAYSPRSLAAMKREVASIVRESGMKVDWRLLSDVQSTDSFEGLVVVRFRGACVIQRPASMLDERGYYAFTYVTDGDVLPFSEVECDKVANSIEPQMSPAQWKDRDTVLGRALGRVLAHELFHMLAKSPQHSPTGVTKSALSPAQLVADHLKMTHSDQKKLAQ
jgi:hypothetical protein